METAQSRPARAGIRTPPRRVVRCLLIFLPGLLATGAAFALSAPTDGTLLIWDIDNNGWHFLAAAAAFLSLCSAICWTAVEMALAAPRAWRTATAYVVVCVVASGALLVAWPAAVIGFLSFGTEYRTAGTVEGREVVVQNGMGLGDSSLRAGYRDGAYVKFANTEGDILVRDAPPFADWSFSVHGERRGQIVIAYTYAPGGPGGTLVVPHPH